MNEAEKAISHPVSQTPSLVSTRPDEDRVQTLGREIFARSQDHKMNLFDKGFWSGKMMEWSMQYPAFKTEMFRFVDVLPSLHDASQIAQHIREYFLRPGLDFPSVIRAGMGMATATSLTAKIAASSIRKNVTRMAESFITGTDAQSARPVLEKLWNEGFAFTVDILGEAAVSEKEAEDYQRRYLDLVEGLARDAKSWGPQPLLEEGSLGPVPRANVSVKCSSLYSQVDSFAFRATVEAIKNRLRPILLRAQELGVFVNLDMEQSDYRELILTVAEELFTEARLEKYPYFGIVVQAYLKSSAEDLLRLKNLAQKRGVPLTVRLVKGAYWDYEVISSEQRGWEPPVFLAKAETDVNYERCTEILLDAHPHLLGAFGSHNVRSLAFAMAAAEKRGLPKSAVEVQMLYGMAEAFKRAISGLGYRVREYAPVGEMLPGMAYLVRRLLENTSNEGFLRAKFVSQAAAELLLQDPRVKVSAPAKPVQKEKCAMAFQNEPYRDFSRAEVREDMERALARVRKELPIRCLPIVDGRLIDHVPTREVPNPSKLSEKICLLGLSTTDVASQAVRASVDKAMKTWARKPAAERAAVIRRVGEIIRTRKSELSAVMTLEIGKNFREADADVAEAIDFCLYYAQEMERLSVPRDMSTPGESNRYVYSPRGPTVAISPWNFPLAILCGMTVGPLVAGNPVIMKPAEQSSAIAFKLYEILREAGVPAEAVHLVPGEGESVGDYLVKHPEVHIVNFTGSRAVGLSIMQEAARLAPGQRHIKRVVAEMGGKNAVIVDEDADLDEAVQGCLNSVLGFQGQKCSALSRLIVLEPAYEKFKNRLCEALMSVKMGPADDPSARLGPVIDAESQARLNDVIESHRTHIAAVLDVPSSLQPEGHYVPAAIFESFDPMSDLGQREFFGPLVTLFRAKTFDDALKIANNTDYALTGGLYSRSPKNLERIKEEFDVGNLYINRGITGALVFRQPFGGFKLSGVGAKAGGPDYLLQFLEPRTITENTLRRGFAPETTS